MRNVILFEGMTAFRSKVVKLLINFSNLWKCNFIRNENRSSLVVQWIEDHHCHCNGSGCCFDMSLIPGLGSSTCPRCGQRNRRKKERKRNNLKAYTLGSNEKSCPQVLQKQTTFLKLSTLNCKCTRKLSNKTPLKRINTRIISSVNVYFFKRFKHKNFFSVGHAAITENLGKW